jgi:protein archease
MPYELIDHTADIGIYVSGSTIKDLFETAAIAMVEQIVDTKTLKGRNSQRLQVSGIDKTDLLINFLRELLSVWTIGEHLVKNVYINDIDNTYLTANITWDKFNPKTHEILTDIKAVTYHGIRVKQKNNTWQATIIFDV